ncbi:FAD:protein FMN transferase [Ureibacillus thermophilus]|uniref:FAD:protein FMN transferase n=2 Tax=Ureibacillus thermophilus TaxID=367743 RepID=A0A4P6UNE4_9BACL|nr:FAD:protein FMN transferase [Ureibacillus thermophilus]
MNMITTKQEDHNASEMDSIKLNIMNTNFRITIENRDGFEWKNHVISFLQYIEREFSRFRKNNELWYINEAPKNQTICVSPILYDMLKKAEEYRKKTEGRFSPYLLIPLENHGYNRSFPFQTANHEAAFLHYENESEPLIFKENFQFIKNTDQKIDLGGIAKGYAVEAIAKWLKNNTSSKYGIVDGGGDMSIWSNGEKTWKIGIQNPFDESKTLGFFNIQNGGVATSNIVYRSWMQGNIKKHHLLDGRNGMPVVTDIVQATVIMEHCTDAEVGAKVCFMAKDASIDSVLANISKKFSYLLVHSNGNIETGGNNI